jgi:hypothetical protein
VSYPGIRSIHFDRAQRPKRATISTNHGPVRVVWKDVAGDRCWFSSGTGDAKREAVPAIRHLEQMCRSQC